MIAGWLLGCHNDHSKDGGHDGEPPPDTGTAPACAAPPSLEPLAPTNWTSPLRYAAAGDSAGTLAVTSCGQIVVGEPLTNSDPDGPDLVPAIAVLDLPDLTLESGWMDPMIDNDHLLSGFGDSVAVHDFPEGTWYAAGADFHKKEKSIGFDFDGGVYVFHALPPSGSQPTATDAADLILRGSAPTLEVGSEFLIARLSDRGGPEFVVEEGSVSNTPPVLNSTIYAVDPTLTGEHVAADVATKVIRDDDSGLGYHMSTWDGDGDGIVDLIAQDWAVVDRFASPWTGDLTVADAETQWTNLACDGLCDFGYSMTGRDDLDSDGQPDLVIGAFDQTLGDLGGAGAVYVVPGGQLTNTDAADLPIRILGDERGGEFGAALATE